jgi:hypothetical protein
MVNREAGIKVALFVVVLISCIWLSGAMGGYLRPIWGGNSTGPTPSVVVCIGGWFLLLLALVIGIVYVFTGFVA